MTQTKDVYIVSAVRTPIGGLSGSLSQFTAVQLGSIAIKGAIEKANIKAEEVEEVFFGNVLTANLGQNPARQAALGAGIPNSVVCTTVNKVCASAMKASILGAQSILLGENDIVVVGGQESMTNTPYYIPKARSGCRYGNQQIVDGIIQDGLYDVYNQYQMGVAADATAAEYGISREEQDDFAIRSYKLSQETVDLVADEIVPVEIPATKRTPAKTVTMDDEINHLNEAKLRAVRPAFVTDGTVTAPNSSTISDGASALVLASKEKVEELGLKPIAKIIGWGEAAHDPAHFTTAPSLAIPKALKHAHVSQDEVDFFEINEAFAVVSLVNSKILNIPIEKLNVFGGACSKGHPLGCSGARIMVTLINVLKKKGGKIGCAAICNGGGGASSVVLEVL
ncbi:acetyl-CoA acetyltransferase [Anaeromyces robustus]|jgi:acetyl-CoA C-acetyltransferase|uniref:acetyl-CoA C-acetyltransferase n=1 Tax=Anaeromyces robustus TaxID=1754192 RepID=A0A1Y1XDT0_9FUNG|nr:acetyl-CoA acetyltransferase [Anaeromyces robustus]|eukprot:ORX83920.1 acetyl-CoA acetyltransferase [Anaeromyces robustus]